MGHETWDMGHGTWDKGQGERIQGIGQERGRFQGAGGHWSSGSLGSPIVEDERGGPIDDFPARV